MKTGVQVSSLKPLLKTPEEVYSAFQKLSRMGCRYVQLQWIDPAVPVQCIADALKASGLCSVSVQEIYETFLENPEYHIRLNALTGGTWLCLSRIPAHLRSEAGLEQCAQAFRRLDASLRENGQRLCFHPVLSDYTPAGGPVPLDGLMEAMPELPVCLDLYHLARSGADMPEWIRRHAGRICMAHFKDAAGTELVPAGSGDVDWTGVPEALESAGVEYAFVEQETWTRDPFVCFSEALSWLNSRVRNP